MMRQGPSSMDLEPAPESLGKMEVTLELDPKEEPEMANTAPVSDDRARVLRTADGIMAIDRHSTIRAVITAHGG